MTGSTLRSQLAIQGLVQKYHYSLPRAKSVSDPQSLLREISELREPVAKKIATKLVEMKDEKLLFELLLSLERSGWLFDKAPITRKTLDLNLAFKPRWPEWYEGYNHRLTGLGIATTMTLLMQPDIHAAAKMTEMGVKSIRSQIRGAMPDWHVSENTQRKEQKDSEELVKCVGEAKADPTKMVKLFCLLDTKMEAALAVLNDPEILVMKDEEGWTVADELASYAPTEVVIILLEKTSDARLKGVIMGNHKLAGRPATSAYDLATATLRARKVDDEPYT